MPSSAVSRRSVEQRAGGVTKPGAGDDQQARADPGGLGVLAAIQVAADLNGKDDRQDRERRRDDAEPHHRQFQLDRAIRRRHPDDGIDRLDDRDVKKQRDEQPIIDIAPARPSVSPRAAG